MPRDSLENGAALWPVLYNTAEAMLEKLIEWRRTVHQLPELAFEEHVTSSFIVRVLSDIKNVDIVQGFGEKTSVIATICPHLPGPAVAFRAEMDAMRVHEETGLLFSSCMPGIMHSGGNDAHIAALLGAAQMISDHCEKLKCPVVLLFQPAENGGSGARPLLEAGFIEEFNVGYMLGMQWWPHLPYGKIFTRRENITALSDSLRIEVLGKGGHGALPHLTVDPMLISGHILVGLQSILAHEFDPQETAVLSFGRIEAGESYNVIPEEVLLYGTMRTASQSVRTGLQRRIREFTADIAKAFRGTATANFALNYDPVCNDPQLVDFIENRGCLALESRVELLERPLLLGKDFSCYSRRIPSCLMFLGTGMELRLYSAHYDIPEGLLSFAAAWESYIAISLASQ